MRKLVVAVAAISLVMLGMIGTSMSASASQLKSAGAQSTSLDPTRAADVYPCPAYVGFTGLCTKTLTNLNMRTGPHVSSGFIITMVKDSDIGIYCWGYGDSVNGDNIWYFVFYNWEPAHPGHYAEGWAAGYYLATGRDPNPNFSNCADTNPAH